MEVHEEAMRLVAAGLNDCEIARRLELPRSTVRDWRHAPRNGAACERCWRPVRPIHFDAAGYAQLLGLYLGDGYVCELARTQRLRIFLDTRYPHVVAETEELLRRGSTS